ncbi:hypothetical protein QSH46_021675 [Xanthomonas arboricola pv. juglandis]|uniref:Uncharacterized protein n=1 Tax=Xanthomonas campestris pv. juglandis TaxID=195709 RepID=A0A2N7UZK4_XANCJ|nr:hypothetical protein [Xanthomonas arboricola]AKU48397.1 hypothetical protein AKJ12_00190 [Xanthomonas arboricola pv. juglandis]KOA96814.1 hypothetical protein AE920_19290 [Xanthomonas arboricola]KOA96920.1 hypothetical protein AE921_18865 [Xanthomonas arboricola]KOB05364.1 hypothetical protein AE922_17920 [Xanthomonas arboricola]KOB09737.1 hypothetical protein AE923_07970 [Xanthomonas arboricola]
MAALDLSQPDTWAGELRDVLNELRPVFRSWELDLPDRAAHAFDAAIRSLGEALMPHGLLGYHFTRLTEEEAVHIREKGLEVLSIGLLERRIASQVTRGELAEEQAQRLLANNQVRDSNRSGKAWFCFYPAYEVREYAVRSLLGHWGGEALYNLNAGDAELGPVLKSMGSPALVEAVVPVPFLSATNGLAIAVARLDLIHQGIRSNEYPEKFEDYSIRTLEGFMVRRVVLHPGREFRELTQSQHWYEPLT